MAEKMATRQAYGEALVEIGEKNKDLVVMDADLSKSTMTASFSKAFPERFFNMGIAEQNMYGVAAGLAASGKTVVASTFAMFAAGRAFEIIRNSIGYPHLNVKICATHAGVTVGEDGASHQAIEDISLMRSIPGMTVLNPSDGASAKKAIEAAIEMKGPCYVRLGRAAVPVIYDEDMDFEIGKGITVKDGNDVAIIATGIMVNEAVIAAGISGHDVSPDSTVESSVVIDHRNLSRLDIIDEISNCSFDLFSARRIVDGECLPADICIRHYRMDSQAAACDA